MTSTGTPSGRIPVRRFASKDEALQAVATGIVDLLSQSVPANQPIAVMLSGGSTPLPAYQMVADVNPTEGLGCYFMLSDERMVPALSPNSNFASISPLFNRLELPEERLLMVNTDQPPEKAAESFHDDLERFFEMGGTIPLGLLGLGNDGRTAGVFNEDDLRRSSGYAVAVERPDGMQGVSVTPKLLQRVEKLVFLVLGENKRLKLTQLAMNPLTTTAGKAVAHHPNVEIWTDIPEQTPFLNVIDLPASRLLSSMKKNPAKIILGLALLAGVIWAIINREQVFQGLEDFLNWVQNIGPMGPVALGLMYILATIFFVPGLILTLAAGFVFGVVKGVITVSIASTLGASAAFLLGRTLLRDTIESKVKANARFSSIDSAVGKQGFKIVSLIRLSPIFPFNLLNYAFGLTRVSFRDYFFGSWLGMFPATVMYVYFGSALQNLTQVLSGEVQGGTGQKILLWVGLAATIVVTVFITRIAREALAEAVTVKEEV